MKVEGHTIIISSPEELLPLITEAVRRVGVTAGHGDVPEGRKLLTPRDIEREFGIHRKMLAHWRREHIGPAYTSFGRRIFYERAVLEEYIAAGRIHTSESTR